MTTCPTCGAPTKLGLTKVQREVLDFLTAYIQKHGFSPTYDEIRNHMGWHSKSGVHRVITALEERGYITRIKGRQQSLMVL